MESIEINGTPIPLLEPPHKTSEWPRRILTVLFKRKRLIACVFLVLALPLILYALATPTKYVAISKVMLQPSRGFLNLSPTSQDAQIRIGPSPETMNSELHIIRSRELLERLVQDVPLDAEQNGSVAPKTGRRKDFSIDAARIAGRLKATAVRQSSVIQIALQSTDPNWAAKVVNRAAELYQDQHLQVHKTRGIEEFYDQQKATLRKELTKAEEAFKAFQEREKVVDADKELASSMSRLASFETNLKTTESAIREIDEKIRILEAQQNEQRENVQAGRSLTTNPLHTRIRDRLVQLELERDSLLQRYTAKDRMVMDKEKEIAELKVRLAIEEKKIMEGKSVSLNTIHDGILHSLLVARAEKTALEARRTTLLKQIGHISSQSVELKNKSYEYDRLQREVNARKEALTLYDKKAEEARISNAMDERKFGNVSIIEKASPPLPTAGFGLRFIVLLSIFFSLAVAVALAFGIEFLNTTLRDEADIEEQIGLPVLATIQYYRS